MDPIKQQRPPGVDALFKGEPTGKAMLDDSRKWILELEGRIDKALIYAEKITNAPECSQDIFKP